MFTKIYDAELSATMITYRFFLSLITHIIQETKFRKNIGYKKHWV